MTNLIPFPDPTPKEDEPDYAAMISNPYELSDAEMAMNKAEMEAHISKVIAKSAALKKEAEELRAWEKARVPNKPFITMKLVRTNFYTRWPCHVCGGTTEKVSILCEGYDDSPDGGRKFRVCERCLEAGQDHVDKKLRDYADDLAGLAQCLRGLIGQLKIPSFAEYQAATKEVDEEYAREWASEDPDGYAASRKNGDAATLDDIVDFSFPF